MKSLALLLIVCIVFLSAFSGSLKPLQVAEKTDCCAKAGKSSHCPKSARKKQQGDSCEKNGCNMLLTCSICGFLAVEPVTIRSSVPTYIENPTPTYKIGNSAAYLPSDWKPPKV